MSTTSASCCCGKQEPLLNIGYFVKGSGHNPPTLDSHDYNGNSLNLNIATVDTCIPCGQGVHGGIRIWIALDREWSAQDYKAYSGTCGQTNETILYPTIFPVVVNYGDVEKDPNLSDWALQYFPNPSDLGYGYSDLGYIAHRSAWQWAGANLYIHYDNPYGYCDPPKMPEFPPYILKSQYNNDYKKLLRLIKERPLAVDERGTPFKICDCFTDNLYTSPGKSDYENSRAEQLNRLCEVYNVGVNAANITWKPSVYVGKHDTTVSSPSKTLNPGEMGLAKCINTNHMDSCCKEPRQINHATTFVLPKNFEKQNIKKPLMINLPYIVGKHNTTDQLFKPPDAPTVSPSQNPAYREKESPYDGKPQEPYPMNTGVMKNLRLFLYAMRLCPDGLNGYPFEAMRQSTDPAGDDPSIPGMFNSGYAFMNPTSIGEGRFTDALSQLLTPSTPRWDDCITVTEERYTTGNVYTCGTGCQCIHNCESGGYLGSDCQSSGRLVQHGAQITEHAADLPFTNVHKQNANIYYSSASNRTLINALKKNGSLLYYTMNDDTDTVCPLDNGTKDQYSACSGPSQRGHGFYAECCPGGCSGQYPRGPLPVCPYPAQLVTDYYMGEVLYDSINISPTFKTLRFYIDGYGYWGADYRRYYQTKKIKHTLQSKIYGPKTGCGKWFGPDTDAVPTHNQIYNWWNMDGGKLLTPENNTPQFYNAIKYRPELWVGENAELVPESSTPTRNPECCTPCPFTCREIKGGNALACIEVLTQGFIGCPGDTGVSTTYRWDNNVNCSGCATPDWDNSGDSQCGTDDPTATGRKIDIGVHLTMTICDALRFMYNITPETPDFPKKSFCEDVADAGAYNCCCTEEPVEPCTPDSVPGMVCEKRPPSFRNNPSISYSGTARNYGELLSNIGSLFSIKRMPVKLPYRYVPDPNTGEVLSITTKQFKQTLITQLYGKNLEYGKLDLQTYSDSCFNFGSVGGEYRTKKEDEKHQLGILNNLQYLLSNDTGTLSQTWGHNYLTVPSWPQGIFVNPGKGGIGGRLIPATEDGFKEFIQDVITNRTSKYPPQVYWTTLPIGKYDINAVDEYWVTRGIYELADTFATSFNTKIKTAYYRNGIPDLSVSTVKLKVRGNGYIEVGSTEPYNLNWFWNSYTNIIDFMI